MAFKARDWRYICRTYTAPWPGAAAWWDIYIARAEDGAFLVRLEGEAWNEDDDDYGRPEDARASTLKVGGERALIEWLEKRHTPTLSQVGEALQGAPGFDMLTRMIAFRLHDRGAVGRLLTVCR